ncbi:MAG: polyprenyl synthetase family protein, partial [Pseudomonas sp.]
MRLLDKSDLIALQRNLEDSLTRFAGTELREAAADVTELAVYEAARTYLGRPSKRLLGMTFLVSCHALSSSTAEHDPKHLLAVATALEIRHAGILLHDDIVDGDVVRGGQPTAHHALAASSFGAEGRNAAIFVGDLLAALAPLPILRSGLTPCEKARLVDAMLVLTARVAAGQAEQLHLDTACDIEKISELDILRAHAATFSPYLNCSIHLATILAGIENNVARCILECAVPIGQGFQVQNDLAGLIELDKQLRSGEPDTLTLANTSDLARGRCTALVRAALDRVTGADRARLVAYLSGDNSIDIKDIIDLIRVSGALTHCDTLIANLFAQARRNIA